MFDSFLDAGNDKRVPLARSTIQYYFRNPKKRIVYVYANDVYSNKINVCKDFYYYPEDGSPRVRYKTYSEAESDSRFNLTRGNIQYHLKHPKPHFEKIFE